MTEGRQPEKKVGRLAVMTNAVNFIGGVSFPSIPFALGESGLIGGLLLMGLVAILNEASHRLIVDSSIFHRKLRWVDIHSYEGLVAVPFGRAGEIVLIFSVFVVAFGACIVSINGSARQSSVQPSTNQTLTHPFVRMEGIHNHGQGLSPHTSRTLRFV